MAVLKPPSDRTLLNVENFSSTQITSTVHCGLTSELITLAPWQILIQVDTVKQMCGNFNESFAIFFKSAPVVLYLWSTLRDWPNVIHLVPMHPSYFQESPKNMKILRITYGQKQMLHCNYWVRINFIWMDLIVTRIIYLLLKSLMGDLLLMKIEDIAFFTGY
jgi:hypothetical protein